MSKKKKAQSKTERENEHLRHITNNNQSAITSGQQKKKWTLQDINEIKMLTDAQQEMARCYYQGSHVCGYGEAGTGKTFVAVYLGISDVINKNAIVDKLVIIRSIVQTRSIGFMPGDEEEKTSRYKDPYRQILKELFNRPRTYDDMEDAEMIQFLPTSFVRGITIENAVMVVDEAQNMTFEELDSVVTRAGENTRVIVVGDDVYQNDLKNKPHERTGFPEFVDISSRHMDTVACVPFKENDQVVRSLFVRDWLRAKKQYYS